MTTQEFQKKIKRVLITEQEIQDKIQKVGAQISREYEGKPLLLVDPMLATGSSLVLTYNALCEKGGTPAHTHVAAVVASEQGLDYAMKNMPRQTTTIWTAVVDEELTSRSYIVPGIGDAGDLAYGEKI